MWERRQLRWTLCTSYVALEKQLNFSGLCFPHLPSAEACLTALTGLLRGRDEKTQMVALGRCCQILSRGNMVGPSLNAEATAGLTGLL